MVQVVRTYRTWKILHYHFDTLKVIVDNYINFVASQCRDSADICNLGSLNSSTIFTEKVAGSRQAMASTESADDVKLPSVLMSHDFEKVGNFGFSLLQLDVTLLLGHLN